MTHRMLVASLQSRARSILGPLLADLDRFALVEFPHYANVGDSAIFLGQLAFLRTLDAPDPRYVCDFWTYDRGTLAREIGGGTILLAGGGGLGDLWPEAQRLREEILSTFRANRIVQLPQSIHFHDRAALDRARRAMESHPRFTLLAREERSLAFAQRHFDVSTEQCPDMALFLGPLQRASAPSHDVVWLARGDKEARDTGGDPWPECGGMSARGGVPEPGGMRECGDVMRTDWVTEPYSAYRTVADGLVRLVRSTPSSRLLRRSLTALYAPLARQRLRRGSRILSRGRVVISDRLHGHLLALLLGIPHVIHDNSYGKVSSFYRTWTSSCSLVHWATSRKEALSIARDVLAQSVEAT